MEITFFFEKYDTVAMFVCLTLEIKRSPMGSADSLGTFGVTLGKFCGQLELVIFLICKDEKILQYFIAIQYWGEAFICNATLCTNWLGIDERAEMLLFQD